jgi:hypothetical protein
MMYLFHQYRQSEKEQRLCGNTAGQNAEPSALEKTGSYVFDSLGHAGKEIVKWTTETATWLGVEGIEQMARIVSGIPEGILNGIYAGLNDLGPAIQDARNRVTTLLYRTSDFFRDMGRDIRDSSIVNAILDVRELKNIGTLEKLVDEVQWISVFREDSKVLENATVLPLPADKNVVFGPRELLQSLPLETRQKIYLEFLDKFIPPKIQNEEGVSTQGQTVADRFAAAKLNSKVLHASLGAIMGMDDWNKELAQSQEAHPKSIAKKSLASFYELKKKDMPENFISENLRNDVSHVYAQRSYANVSSVNTDPNLLQEKLAPSRIVGALRLGVVKQKELAIIHQGMEDMLFKNRIITGIVRGKGEVYTGAQKERTRLESETLLDSFQKMGGIEKLVLMGAALYAFSQFKFVRTTTMWAVGAYMFQKMVLKEKDPIKQWSSLANWAVKGVTGTNANLFGASVTPGYVDSWNEDASRMVNFLSGLGRQEITTQATGYCLLSKTSLFDLANSFSMGAGGQRDLNARRGSPLDAKLADANKLLGWNNNYRQFFDNPENTTQTTDALSYMFFLRTAKKDPLKMQRAREIAELRGHFMPGTSMLTPGIVVNDGNQIADPDLRQAMAEANEDYIKMVAEGRDLILSNHESMTLGQFVATNPDLLSLMPRQKPPVPVKTFSVAPTIPSTFTPVPGAPGTLSPAPATSSTLGRTPGNPGTLSPSPSTSSTLSAAPGTASGLGITPSTPSTVSSAPATSSGLSPAPSTSPSGLGSAPASAPSLSPAPSGPSAAGSTVPAGAPSLSPAPTIPPVK